MNVWLRQRNDVCQCSITILWHIFALTNGKFAILMQVTCKENFLVSPSGKCISKCLELCENDQFVVYGVAAVMPFLCIPYFFPYLVLTYHIIFSEQICPALFLTNGLLSGRCKGGLGKNERDFDDK